MMPLAVASPQEETRARKAFFMKKNYQLIIHPNWGYSRANVVDFEPVVCDKVTITVHATNGAEDARVYEVRVYA